MPALRAGMTRRRSEARSSTLRHPLGLAGCGFRRGDGPGEEKNHRALRKHLTIGQQCSIHVPFLPNPGAWLEPSGHGGGLRLSVLAGNGPPGTGVRVTSSRARILRSGRVPGAATLSVIGCRPACDGRPGGYKSRHYPKGEFQARYRYQPPVHQGREGSAAKAQTPLNVIGAPAPHRRFPHPPGPSQGPFKPAKPKALGPCALLLSSPVIALAARRPASRLPAARSRVAFEADIALGSCAISPPAP